MHIDRNVCGIWVTMTCSLAAFGKVNAIIQVLPPRRNINEPVSTTKTYPADIDMLECIPTQSLTHNIKMFVIIVSIVGR